MTLNGMYCSITPIQLSDSSNFGNLVLTHVHTVVYTFMPTEEFLCTSRKELKL